MRPDRISISTVAALGAGAVALALSAVARPAFAQDAAPKPAAETPAPAISTIEIGVGGVVQGSYKAGEYNGLQDSGAFAIGNVNLRDRQPYTSASAARWFVKTRDLGLDSRGAVADARVQGRVRGTFVFDQIRRNRSDSYQTPFDGAGTNTLTLPTNWLVPTIASPAGNTLSARGLVPSIGGAAYLSTAAASLGAIVTPTAAQTATVDAAAAADLPAFHSVLLSTTRTRYLAGVTFHVNNRWAVDATVNPEHKDGLKPMGTVSRNTGGDISTIIPDRIDNTHNQVTAGVSFDGERALMHVGYYGSFFTNHVSSMSWQNWATAAHTTNTMSSAPSNEFNQVNGNGVIKMGAASKLVVSGSYGRATQNDAFLTDSTTPVVPVSTLNGLVVSTMGSARFTSRPAKHLNLVASYRYQNRDNRTAVNLFQYADAGEAPAGNANFPGNPLGAVVAQNANANRPYRPYVESGDVEANYALGGGQWITPAYDFERLNRSCPGSWISCADAAVTNENTARIDWRTSAISNLTARVGYAHSVRRTPLYNENAFLALVPYANVSPAAATGGASAYSLMLANGWTGFGPAAGFATTTGNQNLFFPSNNALANTMYANNNRISEIQGFRRYWVADRDRNKLRSSLSYQAGESFSFEGGVDVNRDNYPTTTYGLQNLKGWNANGDVTYSPSDFTALTVFYTYEDQRGLSAGNTYTANSNAATVANGQAAALNISGASACNGFTTLLQRNNNNKVDPCLDWTSDVQDLVHTVGATYRTKVSRADVSATVTFTRATMENPVTGGNYANNPLNGAGGPPTTFAAFYLPATAFPTVESNIGEVRLNGLVPVTKSQSLRVAYAYLKMSSNDWTYAGMQIGAGTIAGVLPSNEQAFNYRVNVLAVSYVLAF